MQIMAPGAAKSSRPRILHVLLQPSEEVFSYNELCLARAGSQAIGICTFFRSKVRVSPEVQLFEGDGSFRGFFAALRRARLDRDYDVVHAHSPHVACLLLLWSLATRRELPPTVFTVEHSYTNSNLKTRNRLLDLVAFGTSNQVVLVSEAARSSFPAVYRRLAGGRLRVVPHAADLVRLDRSRHVFHGVAENKPFTVACVGRLIPIKNPMTVLEAFLKVRLPAKLVFVGEGELAGVLRERASETKAGASVELAGLVPREQVYGTLDRTDLFVSASLGEGMPVAVLEAMACRCPVVLSDIPPHREIVADADFIPVFPPDDPEALAAQIARFREMTDAERRQIGSRCRELVEARFSLSATHAQYDAIYCDLVLGRK